MWDFERDTPQPPPGAALRQYTDGFAEQRAFKSNKDDVIVPYGAKPGPPKRPHNRPLPVPGQGDPEDVLVPETRRRSELTGVQRAAADAQQKLMHNLNHSHTSAVPKRKQILALFRKCAPDEFGILSRDRFVSGVRKEFDRITEPEANALFDVVDRDGSGDVSCGEFTQMFDPVDGVSLQARTARRPRALPKAVSAAMPDALAKEVMKHNKGAAEEAAARVVSHRPRRTIEDTFPAKPLVYSDLDKTAQRDYKDHLHLQQALEAHRPSLQRAFTRPEAADGASTYTRTKLTFEEASHELKRVGISLAPSRLKEMYIADAGSGGGVPRAITYSELAKRTNAYFDRVERTMNADMEPVMEFRGAYVGCRKGAGDHQPLSPRRMDTLAPMPLSSMAHESSSGAPSNASGAASQDGRGNDPAGMTFRSGEAAGKLVPRLTLPTPPPAETSLYDDDLSKFRWTDKTVDAPKMQRSSRRHYESTAQATPRNPITWGGDP